MPTEAIVPRRLPSLAQLRQTAKKAKAEPVDPSTTQQAPGGGGCKVWVNTSTKVFHKEGDGWRDFCSPSEVMALRPIRAGIYDVSSIEFYNPDVGARSPVALGA